MENLTVTGIVCRYANYRDYDRMLTILTTERGVMDVAAYASRRAKSPLFAGAQLFAYGEYVLTKRSGRYSAAQFDLRESFSALGGEYGRLALATYVAQSSAAHATHAQHADADSAFLLCYHTLSFLCYGRVHPVDAFICYLLKHLILCGYAPLLDACALCRTACKAPPYFSYARGGVLCENCGPGDASLPPLGAEALRRMAALPLEDIDKIALPAYLRDDLVRLLLLNVEYHLGGRGADAVYKTICREYGENMGQT